MRERVEDIGRILVLLDKILENEIFPNLYIQIRNKDFVDWFYKQPREKQEDVLTLYLYGIENLREDLHEVMDICRGEDVLNRKEDSP